MVRCVTDVMTKRAESRAKYKYSQPDGTMVRGGRSGKPGTVRENNIRLPSSCNVHE